MRLESIERQGDPLVHLRRKQSPESVERAIKAAVTNATTKPVVVPRTYSYKPSVAHVSNPAPVGRLVVPSRAGSNRGIVVPQIHRSQPSAHSFLTGLRNIITPIRGMDPRDFTSSYGPRIHPISHRSSFHSGIDIGSPMGTPVIAPANAVLADLNEGDSIYGNQVILAHNRHVDTMYGHLSRFAPGLKPGMKIRAGDLIGYVGSTGYSTGPHLHWETWRDGESVNPMTFLGG